MKQLAIQPTSHSFGYLHLRTKTEYVLIKYYNALSLCLYKPFGLILDLFVHPSQTPQFIVSNSELLHTPLCFESDSSLCFLQLHC